jgi:hypothetical protein
MPPAIVAWAMRRMLAVNGHSGIVNQPTARLHLGGRHRIIRRNAGSRKALGAKSRISDHLNRNQPRAASPTYWPAPQPEPMRIPREVRHCAWHLFLQPHKFERFKHADRPRARLIIRANQAERPFMPQQKLALPLVCNQNCFVTEDRIYFSQ